MSFLNDYPQLKIIKEMSQSDTESVKIASYLISGKYCIEENIDEILENIDIYYLYSRDQDTKESDKTAYSPAVDSLLLFGNKYREKITAKLVKLIEEIELPYNIGLMPAGHKYFEVLARFNGGWPKYYKENKHNFSEKFKQKVERKIFVR